MFDACDPMLEARLAESVDAMMLCLHQPEAEALAQRNADGPVEMRVETVTAEELERSNEGGVSAEYLSLLIDTCTTGDEATQAAARALLFQDFAVAANADLQQATEALVQCLEELNGTDADGPTHDRLAELCSAIAASVILEGAEERQ